MKNESGGALAFATLMALGIGIATLTMATAAKAAPPEMPLEWIPTVSDIMKAQSVAELTAYYNLVGELHITQKIDYDTYTRLYQAYYDRWYELL